MSAAKIVCPRHGEIRPPMPPPVLDRRDLWRCPYCGMAMVLPSVAEANRKRMGAYLRV